eukprot:6882335-Pyramimonas_sp.AAC.1
MRALRRCLRGAKAAVRAPGFADAQRALCYGGLWTRSRMANSGDRLFPGVPMVPHWTSRHLGH